MDVKITKKRLFNVFDYEWLKAIAIIGLIVLFWHILYTVFAARLTDGQKFYILTYEGVYTGPNKATDKFAEGEGGGVFSYDIYSVTESNIVTVGDYTAYKLLENRLEVCEGDIIVIGGGNEEYDPEEERENLTPYQSLVNIGKIMSVTKLLKGAYEYTVGNGFITETESGYTVNEGKIEQFFREERIKATRNYRRTYVTEEAKKEGVKKEIERIEKIYKNYLSVSKAIENAKERGEDFLNYKTSTVYRDEGIDAYGIDLGKLNNKNDIKGLWYLSPGGTASADGMVLAVFDLSAQQPDLQYEALGVIDYLIRNYSDYAD